MAIDLTPVANSSNVFAIGHDGESTMAVRFKGKDGTRGALYHYSPITPGTFEAISEAESVGSAVSQLRKISAIACVKIDETAAVTS